MTFNEIILALLPFITLALIILIAAKLGKPITWLEDLGRYPVSKKKADPKPKFVQTNNSSPKIKTYHITVSLDKSDK